MALDLGKKRCGVAVTDELRIAATGLATVPSASLEQFLKSYFEKESVDCIVVGEPRNLNGEKSDASQYIDPMLARLRKAFPAMTFERADERFTSALAHRAMIDGGMRKSRRRDKAVADVMAATIILNDYLESRRYKEPL